MHGLYITGDFQTKSRISSSLFYPVPERRHGGNGDTAVGLLLQFLQIQADILQQRQRIATRFLQGFTDGQRPGSNSGV